MEKLWSGGILHVFLTSALHRGVWSTSYTDLLLQGQETAVSTGEKDDTRCSVSAVGQRRMSDKN